MTADMENPELKPEAELQTASQKLKEIHLSQPEKAEKEVQGNSREVDGCGQARGEAAAEGGRRNEVRG
ncbi:hypothetical protein L596_026467 [Steinernema carpocapsae]|uniref:Uncharacterized protein n=1 Tax=Steinernema carpocapsae TaxID=34508 RepID=A0A4V5ZY64_STECR|nr:hypothetical protein L596_026467 [Steinernema carpocapsae]